VVVGGGGDGGVRGGAASGASRTATVERRDLVEREDVDGTLGYGGSRSVVAPGGDSGGGESAGGGSDDGGSGGSAGTGSGAGSGSAGGSDSGGGTITRLPAEGSVVRIGQSLWEVDGEPTAWLMRGRRPAWRSFERGMSDGEDVRQLEATLKALGHDPYGAMTVDDELDAATEAAIERFQAARGMKQDGKLELGEVVFLPDDARVAARKQSVGSPLAAGQPMLEATSTKRVVTVELEASRQTLARPGRRAEVELPDGRTVRGRIATVSRVAASGGGGDDSAGGGGSEGDGSSEATVKVTIRVRGRLGSRLDQAPVTVSLVSETRRDVLTVPVTALLALEGGRYAVEVVGRDGSRRRLPVEAGAFADGYVEVSGRGLREGMRVAVPDAI
jgi:hypothetical protein